MSKSIVCGLPSRLASMSWEATCDVQHATCDARHATCNMQHATCDARHAAHTERTAGAWRAVLLHNTAPRQRISAVLALPRTSRRNFFMRKSCAESPCLRESTHAHANKPTKGTNGGRSVRPTAAGTAHGAVWSQPVSPQVAVQMWRVVLWSSQASESAGGRMR